MKECGIMREENDIQASIVAYLAAVAPEIFVYGIPNASIRRRGGRAGNAVPGLRAGVPDLGLVLPGGQAGFIECKSARGILSADQIACRDAICAAGGRWTVARGIDDVREALALWDVKTREVRS